MSFFHLTLAMAEADLGDCGFGGFGRFRWNPPKLLKKKLRCYNTLTWPPNAGNPFSEAGHQF